MTLFNSFIGTFGLLLLFTTGVTAFVFKSSTAPFAVKFVVPVCLVFLTCFTPYRVRELMGYPTTDAPPAKAELVAFFAHDDDTRVSLWLREGSQLPRAYDIPLDAQTKEALRAAMGKLGRHERVGLKQGKRGKAHGFFDFDTPPAPFAIDENAFSLPKKGEPQ